MKKTTFLLLLLGLAVLIGGGTVAYQRLSAETEVPRSAADTAPTAASDSRTPAPDFRFTDRDGQTRRLSDLYGTPIILNFWASWCPPCKNEMPHFQALYEEYGDAVQFVMLNMTDGQQETAARALAFLQETQYTFPVYFDTGLEGAMAYNVSSIPATYLIDSAGRIADRAVGQLSEQNLRSMLEQALPADEPEPASEPDPDR